MTNGTSDAPMLGALQAFSNDLADAVERAGASVVRVNARRRLPGTGIVWSATNDGGYVVVTANHIVERDEDITITTPDGRELPATLFGRDGGTDLAALRVTGEGLTPATRADGDARVGTFVLALGRARDLSATSGVVSALLGPGRAEHHGPGGHGGGGEHRGPGGPGGFGGRGRRIGQLIASDAAMFPGFSGGPLVDAGGRVLGLLSSHFGRGHTMAIPAAQVDKLVTALQQHGSVRRGYLGVGAQQAQLPAALKQAHGIEQELGLLVVSVDESGPAGQAGLTLGDILLSVNGQPTQGLDDLRATLDAEAVGTRVMARILRGGEPRDVAIVVGEQTRG